jgi:outer membrane protein TolC/LysM repeat protein
LFSIPEEVIFLKRSFILGSVFALTLSNLGALAETGRSHTVASGETLFSIAQAELGSGSRWSEIASLNSLTPPYVIKIGMRLTIPSDQASSEPQALPAADAGDSPSPLIVATVDSPMSAALIDEIQADTFPVRSLPPWSMGEVIVPRPKADIWFRSPEDAITAARRENADLRALAAEIEKARAGRTSASLAGRFNPEVEGAFGRRFKPNETTQTTDRFNDWGVDVWQELEIAGQRTLRLSVADLEIEKTIAESERAERDLLLEVREAYWEAVASTEFLKLVTQEEAAHIWMAEAARFRYEAGDVAMIEVTLAEANAEEARSEKIQAEQNRTDAIARLTRAVGLPSDSPAAPGMEFPPLGSLAGDDWESRALRSRRDLRAELINVRLENERSRLSLAEGRPNIRAGFGYVREEGNTDIYTLKFGIPLPLTNLKRGESEEARAAARVSESRSDALRRRAVNETRAALERLRSARRRHELVERGVVARANENLALAAQAYAEGKIGLPSFLTHFEQATTNRRLGIETKLDWQRAMIDLERAVGTELNQGGEPR